MNETKKKVVARMTIRKDGKLTTVELRTDPSFSVFYHWFNGKGRGRKPARPLPTSGRHQGSLENISEHFPGSITRITILNKKLYRHLQTCTPGDLPGGVTKLSTTFKLTTRWGTSPVSIGAK